MDNDQFIVDLLLQQGIITEAQVEAAKQAQKESIQLGDEPMTLLDGGLPEKEFSPSCNSL